MPFLVTVAIAASNAPLMASSITFTITPPGDSVINMNEGVQRTVSVEFNDTLVTAPPPLRIVDSTGYATITSYYYDPPGGGHDSLTACNLILEPDFLDSGSDIIRLIAFDSQDDSLILRIRITVIDVPRPPVISNLPFTLDIDEGEINSFQVVAYDLDDPGGTSLRFSIAPDTSWVDLVDSIGPTGIVDVSPPYSIATWDQPIRTFTFFVTVVDQTGQQGSGTLTVRVHDTNRPPYLTRPSHDTVMTAYQNTPFSFTFAAADSDGGDQVTISDSENIVGRMQQLGWSSVDFDGTVLSFTPNTSFEGLLDTTGDGYTFTAGDRSNATDVVRINFFVRDLIPPEAVSGLNGDSSGMEFGTIRLSWIAPHEDGGAGGAVQSYAIRYDTVGPGGDPNGWWSGADNIPQQPPAPLSPGTAQSLLIGGLVEHRPYWFGIRAVDASGNISPVAVTGEERVRRLPPAITLLGDIPEFVRPDSMLYFAGVTSDSGGVISEIRYSAGGAGWVSATIDSTRDSSPFFIRKFFHFSHSAGSGDSLVIRIRAADAQDSTVITRIVRIDNVPPSMPTVTSDPDDSLTNDNSFQFSGTKDSDATVWMVLTLGQNPGEPVRITDPGDTGTSWNHNETVYYQGEVIFEFYCTDLAGNSSGSTVLEFWLVLSSDSPNIINPDSVEYFNSLVFNPQTDSLHIAFPYLYVSQFNLTILNRLGTIIYTRVDSLAPSPGRHDFRWDGVMNSGPGSGLPAPDGRYLMRFSARAYPVSPFDIPIEAELILDSYAPYEVDFFPRSGSSMEQAREINKQTVLSLTVGDTGAAGIDTKADILNPYLTYGQSGRIDFSPSTSVPGQWTADLAALPQLPAGNYEMTLVLSDEADNTSQYQKFFRVTAGREITGFVNYPNPFAPSNEQTRISYVLGSAASELILEIYDSSGDLVFIRSLDAAYLTPQAHEFAWDGRSSWGKALNNGVYFARLTGGITTEFLKIAIADR
jgi:hypothetical protein